MSKHLLFICFSVLAPPTSPLGFHNTSTLSTSFNITWTTPSDTGGRTDIFYIVTITGRSINITVNITDTQYTFTGLNPFTTYTVSVRAGNGVSDQDSSNDVNRTVSITVTTLGGIKIKYLFFILFIIISEQTSSSFILSVSLSLTFCLLLLLTISSTVCIIYRLWKRKVSSLSQQSQRSTVQDTSMEFDIPHNIRSNYHVMQKRNHRYIHIDEIASFPPRKPVYTDSSSHKTQDISLQRKDGHYDHIKPKVEETSTAVTNNGPSYEYVGDKQSDATLKMQEKKVTYLKIL